MVTSISHNIILWVTWPSFLNYRPSDQVVKNGDSETDTGLDLSSSLPAITQPSVY